MKPFRSRRSSYRLLVLFLVAATVYIMFQVFSVNILSVHNKLVQKHEKRKYFPEANLGAKRAQKHGQGEHAGNKIPVRGGSIHTLEESARNRQDMADVEGEHEDRTHRKISHNDNFKTFQRTMHGVHPDLLSKYKDTTGQFQCLHTKEHIPVDQVNDNYCDCVDGTDEPGTPACQNNRFYCAMQLNQQRAESLKSIPASFVNDGICDCCDGSDEWMGNLLPDNIRIENPSRKFPVNHAPCKSTCQEVADQEVKLQNLIKMGQRLKQEYIKEAFDNSVTDKKYGSQGEYFRLSHSCFEIYHGGFEYKVCPFVEATQTENKRNRKSLGHSSVTWLNKSEMKMTGGDSLQCPGAISRSSIIKFECGLEDKLLSVRESSICEYYFIMTSPAAC